MYYLDTNIFIYANEKSSIYYKSCNKFLESAIKDKIILSTSTETIQEIMYYSHKYSKLESGIQISNEIIDLIDVLIPVDEQLIKTYLKFTLKYQNIKNIQSRDFLHLATCVENKLNKVITYDRHFKKFKEIKSQTPEEFFKSTQ